MSELQERDAVIVLGMHRSGTSALTRVLSLLGCELPKTLMGADQSNEAGHWESNIICRLNDDILASAGILWSDWTEIDASWFNSSSADEFLLEGRKILNNEFGDAGLFVLKDPRICRILPFWKQVLQAENIKPLIVFPIRNPLEVATSLQRRNGFDVSYGLLVWLRHVLDAEFFSRGLPRFFTNYDRLIADWKRVATDIESDFGLQWPRESTEAEAEIKAFLSEKYRHHRETAESVIENDTLSEWIRNVFYILNKWAVSGEQVEDIAVLNRVRAELATATPAFAPLLARGEEDRQKVSRLETELEVAVERSRMFEETVAKQLEKALQAQLEKDTACAKLHDSEDTILRLESEIKESHAAYGELEESDRKKFLEQEAKNTATVSQLNLQLKELDQLRLGLEGKVERIVKIDSDRIAAFEASMAAERDRYVSEIDCLKQALQEADRNISDVLHQLEEYKQAAQLGVGNVFAALLDVSSGGWLVRRLEARRMTARLKQSGIFDADSYLRCNPDVAAAGIDPYRHFVEFGVYEGRDPTLALAGVMSRRSTSVRSAELNREIALPASWPTQLNHEYNLPKSLEKYIREIGSRNFLEYYRYWMGLIEQFDSSQVYFESGEYCSGLCESIRARSNVLHDPGVLPEVSIIVPVYNKLLYTLTCISSIIEMAGEQRLEIIIADDGSTDRTGELMPMLGPLVHHVVSKENQGFLLNCNAAAKSAKGTYVVFLNNDTLVLPGWLDAIVDTFRRDQNVGLVGSKLLNGDGTLQEAGGIIWRDGSAWNFGRGGNAADPIYNYTKDVDYCSGASIAFPRDLWQKLGGFDPLFVPAYCEDSDIAFRVRALGYRTVLQPESSVIHHEGVSHGRDPTESIKKYQEINSQKLFQRWYSVMESEHFDNAQNVFLARDRSKNCPHILIVDHYVPQFDKDAGSLTIFQYIRLFAKSGFHVTFWPENLNYDAQYVRQLQRLGVEVLYGPQLAGKFSAWMRENGRYLKYALLSRAHVATEFIGPVRKHSAAKVIFYGHDLSMRRLRQEREVNPSRKLSKEIVFWESLERKLWAASDIICYPSEDECAFVRQEVPGKVVRPLIPYFFEDEEIVTDDIGFADRETLLFVGGFRHRPNGDAMIWFVKEILPAIRILCPGTRLVIAGSHPPAEVEALAGEGVEVLGYVSEERLQQLYAEARIVVVPLRFGAGVKGKVVEAMRYGVPVVTTSVGIQGYPDLADFMAVADDAKEFAEAVAELYQNEDRRAAWVKQGTAFIHQHFSVAAVKRGMAAEIPEFDDPVAKPVAGQ